METNDPEITLAEFGGVYVADNLTAGKRICIEVRQGESLMVAIQDGLAISSETLNKDDYIPNQARAFAKRVFKTLPA